MYKQVEEGQHEEKECQLAPKIGRITTFVETICDQEIPNERLI